MAKTLVHWPSQYRLHGILCNRYHHRHDPRVTDDMAEVTCSTCLGLLAERALQRARNTDTVGRSMAGPEGGFRKPGEPGPGEWGDASDAT